MLSPRFLSSVAFVSLGAFALLGLGCTRVKTARAPDGAYSLSCERGMKACVDQAATLCGDDGYTILSGTSSTHLLGGSSSSYRSAAESAELTLRCGLEEVEENSEGIYELPERTDEPVPAAPALAPAHHCTPGATQRCVGAGACDGGQICKEDGSGYGSCDCGDQTSSQKSSPALSPQEIGSTGPVKEGEKKTPTVPAVGSEPAPLKKD